MKFLHGGNVVRLPIEAITVEGRLRTVRQSCVENLMLMAEDTGITTPIHVRKVRDRHVLIDGAHRLEAARLLGLPDIAALVVECRADEARAMEASNNLGAARMTPLQTAVFVASWKRDYYALHPDRKPGVFKGNQFAGNGKEVTVTMTLTKIIADAFGVSEPTVFRALRAGENLTREEAAQLDAAPRRVAMKDLMVLGKIGDPAERADVVARLAANGKLTAVQARRARRVEAGLEAPVKNPEERAYLALVKAWSRAGNAERKRFLRDFRKEVWRAQNAGPPLFPGEPPGEGG